MKKTKATCFAVIAVAILAMIAGDYASGAALIMSATPIAFIGRL